MTFGYDSNPKPKTILERLNDAETTLGYILKDTQGLKSNMAALVELCRAIIKANGEGFDQKVQAAIAEEQKRQRTETNERDRAVMEQLVAAGALVVADAVGEDSVIVGREYSTDGQLMSERTSVTYQRFPVEVRLALKDQSVGFQLELPNGRFEITEIYNPGPNSN